MNALHLGADPAFWGADGGGSFDLSIGTAGFFAHSGKWREKSTTVRMLRPLPPSEGDAFAGESIARRTAEGEGQSSTAPRRRRRWLPSSPVRENLEMMARIYGASGKERGGGAKGRGPGA